MTQNEYEQICKLAATGLDVRPWGWKLLDTIEELPDGAFWYGGAWWGWFGELHTELHTRTVYPGWIRVGVYKGAPVFELVPHDSYGVVLVERGRRIRLLKNASVAFLADDLAYSIVNVHLGRESVFEVYGYKGRGEKQVYVVRNLKVEKMTATVYEHVVLRRLKQLYCYKAGANSPGLYVFGEDSLSEGTEWSNVQYEARYNVVVLREGGPHTVRVVRDVPDGAKILGQEYDRAGYGRAVVAVE